MASTPGFPGLVVGGSGSIRLVVDEAGFARMRDALQAVPVDLRKNLVQSAVASGRGVMRQAESNFYSSIIRRGEEGEGTERGRQTGNFSFGGESAAFHASAFKISKDLFGFGFPFIPDADKRTNYVWRSLEFGLSGKYHAPTTFLDLSELFPRGQHQLPRRFYFTSRDRGTSALRLPKKGRRKLPKGLQMLKSPPIDPGGIEGKHFIERAWTSELERMSGRWKRDVVASTKAFGR